MRWEDEPSAQQRRMVDKRREIVQWGAVGCSTPGLDVQLVDLIARISDRRDARSVRVHIFSRRQNAVVIEVPCSFCDAINDGSIVREVLRDDVAVAFLDRSPVFKGHVLVVPRRHVVTLADLPSDRIGGFFERVQRVSARMPAALDCDDTFVAINNVVSQSVAHLHVHVVPRRRKDGLRGFFWPRVGYDSDAEADEYERRLREALAG